MKYVNKKLLTLGVGLMVTSYNANAAGTAAGTVINNAAVVDFTVGGINQVDVNSNTAGFVVDRKVIFTLVKDDVAYVSVIPGSSAQVLSYTLNNTSNATLDFALTPNQPVGGSDGFAGVDNINAATVSAVQDDGDNVYDAGDTVAYVDELAADTSRKIFVLSSFANSVVNNDIAAINLEARAAIGGTASAQGTNLTNSAGSPDIDDQDSVVDGNVWDNTGDIQNVFGDATGTGGDAASDGLMRALDAYRVVSATIVVTKSSTVISDPINLGVNPKRVPGAIIEYTINVANSGGAAADNVAVTDVLAAELTYSAGTLFVNGIPEDDNNTDADDTPLDVGNPTAGSFSGVTVSASIFAIPAGQNRNIVFRAVVD